MGKEIKMSTVTNVLAWQAAFLAAFSVVYGLHDARSSQQMTLFTATVYNALQRLAWAGSLSWVIFSCVKGYGGLVNEFLSWSAFAPLSRLTFCTYLIHIEIEGMFAFSVLAAFPNDFSSWVTVWYFLGILVISLGVSVILVIAFELPSARAEKLITEVLLKKIFGNPKPLTNANGMKSHLGVDANTSKQFDDKTPKVLNEKAMNADLDPPKYDDIKL